jgi:predicted nucleic-acid-binding protein
MKADKPIRLDANSIVDFLTFNIPANAGKVLALLSKQPCTTSLEVIAEVVYALHDFYKWDREKIRDELKDFMLLRDGLVEKENVLRFALNKYAEMKLDFVDCLLIGYARINDDMILTFDGDLRKALEEKAFNLEKE